MANALKGVPKDIAEKKMTAVKSFGQMLRRYTGLNHLAQAARAVLQNSTQISQVKNDERLGDIQVPTEEVV